MEEYELINTAETLIETAKLDLENDVTVGEIKKKLSLQLRQEFPKANVFYVTDVIEAAIEKAKMYFGPVSITEEEFEEKEYVSFEELESEHYEENDNVEEVEQQIEEDLMKQVDSEEKEPHSAEKQNYKYDSEKYCIPIVKSVLNKKTSLVDSGIKVKNLYKKGKLSYDEYRTSLHVLHALGRYFLERNHVESGIKTLYNIASHSSTESRRFVKRVIILLEDMNEEN